MKTHKAISKWETEQVMSSDSTAHPKHSKIQLLACYHPQSTTQIADWNTSSVFLCKRPTFLSWSFGLRGRLQIWCTVRSLWSYTQGIEAVGVTLVLSLCFATAEESMYFHVKPWYLWRHSGDTSRSPGLVASGAYGCGPRGPYILAVTHLKANARGSGSQSVWI